VIRSARPSDQAYVASTWVSSMLSRDHGARAQSRALRMLIDRMLDRPDVTVSIACDDADENSILGWLVFTRMVSASLVQAPRYVTHYAYVRAEHRRKKIARSLLNAAGIAGPLVYTFDGPSSKKLGRTLLADAIHIPPSQFLGVA